MTRLESARAGLFLGLNSLCRDLDLERLGRGQLSDHHIGRAEPEHSTHQKEARQHPEDPSLTH